jgi:hypothetical protein
MRPFIFQNSPMSAEKKPFVNVDELMPQVSLEQAARFYGVTLPEVKRVGSETRAACFLNCGKTAATGDRALALHDDPTKKWKCHQYGCQKGGNLVSLCDLMKPGPDAGGRPRGDRFKEIARDLQSMVGGATGPSGGPASASAAQPSAEKPKVNVLLKDSENERARGLQNLDAKFVVDAAAMSPTAAPYFRKRPYLTPEVCRAWRMGYLPRDSGGDKAGGTMRGKIVYPYLSEDGELFCWFGRDPAFEEKRAAWEKSDRKDPEPAKFTYVKGSLHRGLELFGQHQLRAEGVKESLQGLGLVLVEGPNDVIRLSVLGVPAVALCSNSITREQAVKAARLAREVGGGVVTVFLDNDPEGLAGMKQCLGYLAQLVPVRLAWSDRMFEGRFRGRQPESLLPEDWAQIRDFLVSGKADWSLS